MKDRSKIGGEKGNPAYRTPSDFRYKKSSMASQVKARQKKGQFRGLR